MWGSGRDDVELGVTSEVHRAKVVGGAVDGSKECGEELAEEGGGEVRPREELEKDMVTKDVGEERWLLVTTRMEREKRSKRSMAKSKNRDKIVFLLLLDTGQKIVPNLMSYKFLVIC